MKLTLRASWIKDLYWDHLNLSLAKVHVINNYKIIKNIWPEVTNVLRQYTIPSATLSAHQEKERDRVAFPDNVVSSIVDIGTHQRSYVD